MLRQGHLCHTIRHGKHRCAADGGGSGTAGNDNPLFHQEHTAAEQGEQRENAYRQRAEHSSRNAATDASARQTADRSVQSHRH